MGFFYYIGGAFMIEYFVDKEEKHKEDLLVHLRAHNAANVEDKTKESRYIYLYKNNQLIGAVTIKFGWSWVGYDSLYYMDLDVLRALISESVQVFKGLPVGYKMYSSAEQRIKDLLQAGFKIIGTTPGTTSSGDTIYLDLVNLEYNHNYNYEVRVLEEELESHKGFIDEYLKEYKRKNNLNILQEEILYVAMDNDVFCGGIYLQAYQDSLYVDLLAVNVDYRGRNIGTKLMEFAEKYARERNFESIDLGTTEFQARPFYEKLGYKVVFTRQNYPIGYECYTLHKKL